MFSLFPPPFKELAPEDLYLDISFPEPPPDRPYVFINMVSSLDGKATVSGSASGIGSKVDRQVMNNLRALSDGVMVGAGTLCAEKISLSVPEHLSRLRSSTGRSSQPLAIIASHGPHPPLHNLLNSKPHNTLITSGLRSSEECKLEIRDILRAIRNSHSIESLLVEGGPSLNHSLLSANLVDEIFLTISPKIIGGSTEDISTIVEGTSENIPGVTNSELVSVNMSESEIFLRYLVSSFR